MNGFIAQLVTLALHGNHVVAGGKSADFLATNSSAQFCEWIRFVRVNRGWFGTGAINESLLARSADGWLTGLRARGVERLQVRRQGFDRPDAARSFAASLFSNEDWTIVLRRTDGRVERWQARWEVGDRARADRRIWRVTYGRPGAKREAPLATVTLAAAGERLHEALTQVHAFSARQRCDGFTESFARALQALAGEPGVEGYHTDMLPPGAPRDVAGMIHACQLAWVFGGMGSWNDLGFTGEDEKEYARVTHALYEALMVALPAAVDAYAFAQRTDSAASAS